MRPADQDDDLLSDKGTLADLAYLLRRGGGPMRALVGGVGSLGLAGYALLVLDDRSAAVLITLFAVWCLAAALLMYHFGSQ